MSLRSISTLLNQAAAVVRYAGRQVVREAPQLLHLGEVRDARQRELEDQGGGQITDRPR